MLEITVIKEIKDVYKISSKKILWVCHWKQEEADG